MDRIKRIKDCFNVTEEISMENPVYVTHIEDIFKHALIQDLGEGDASQIPADLYKKQIKADIIARNHGIVAGLEEIIHILNSYGLKTEKQYKDGDRIDNHELLITIYGQISQILSLERTILNFLQRLCGIATQTKEMVNKIAHTNSFVLATRKTIWGAWDKKAVQCGNGLSHRLGLYDAAMLKENHLKILKESNGFQAIQNSLKKIIQEKQPRFIEVEVSNMREFRKITEVLINIEHPTPKVIMFDHFSPIKIKIAISEAKEKDFYDNLFFEASGNINIYNIKDYAESGVDVISSGELTHSVKSLDLSMLF